MEVKLVDSLHSVRYHIRTECDWSELTLDLTVVRNLRICIRTDFLDRGYLNRLATLRKSTFGWFDFVIGEDVELRFNSTDKTVIYYNPSAGNPQFTSQLYDIILNWLENVVMEIKT